jgi:hypothetical protein
MQPDVIQSVQSVVVAIALGSLVAAWAFQHFHAPDRTEDIRFSVPQQRYFLAVGIHVSIMLAVYAVLVLALYQLVLLATKGSDLIGCWTCVENQSSCPACKNLRSLQPATLVWAALVSALFIRIVVPNVAMTRYIVDRLRSQTHDLALFPFARESLVAALSASAALSAPGFTVRKDSQSDLVEELARYGVASDLTSFLSASTQRSLLEVCSVRRHLRELFDRTHALRETVWDRMRFALAGQLAVGRESAKGDELFNRRLLRRFWQARAECLMELETDFRRLIRHSARALILAEEIGEQVKDKTLSLAISNFVADESDNVLAGYRNQIAEIALSCVPHRAERAEFLKSFGYDAPTPPSLPLRPWLIVFALDFLLPLIPIALMFLVGQNPGVPMARLAAFACIHAISQTVAITWAFYPKIVSNFARPSLYSLPVASYVLCGLGSYLTGALILFVFRVYIPLPYPIILPTLLSSLSFLFMTVGMSVLIDLRLKSSSLDFEQGRVREGAVIALLMLASTLTFQAVMIYAGKLEPTWISACFLVVSAGLGFVMGYYVPSAGAAYLQKARLHAPDRLQPGGVTDSLRRSHARWEHPSYAHPSLQA